MSARGCMPRPSPRTRTQPKFFPVMGLVTIRTVAEMLGIPRYTVSKAIRSGALKAHRARKGYMEWRMWCDDVRDWLKKGQVHPPPPGV